MLPEEILQIANVDVQDYLFANTDEDEKKLLLAGKEIFGIRAPLIAQQIAARKKAEAKLPLFFNTRGIVYPPSINLEQTSSEATGKFKAGIVSNETSQQQLTVADLTGGFGVDSFFLSTITKSIDYVEPDAELLSIAMHNHAVLGNSTIEHHHQTAEEFLDKIKTGYDLIYLDPSRRDSNAKKVFRLADCQPNIQTLLPKIFDYSKLVLVKASPLLDIQQGLTELQHVKKVFVVSVNNECKELLFMTLKGFTSEPSIETINLNPDGTVKHIFSFTFNEEKETNSVFNTPQTYLYEPNASVLKAGAFKSIGEKFDLQKIATSTHLYTSNLLQSDFPGRVFKIENQKLDVKDLVGEKANIITRNYPLKPEEIKKKFKIIDGGNQYVIAFSGASKKFVVLATRLE